MTAVRLAEHEIELEALLGMGAQGSVHRVERVAGTSFGFPVVEKSFDHTPVAGAALGRSARFRDRLDGWGRRLLDDHAVWPETIPARSSTSS